MTTDMWLAPSIKEMKEIVDFDIKYAQKLYGPVVQRHFGAADGDGSGDVSDDERRRREDEQRRREHRRHAHHDRDDDGRGEIGGAGGGRGEAVIHVNQFGSEDATAYQRRRTAWRLAKRAAAKKAAGNEESKDTSRATFMTSTTEVVKVVTNVSADDVAIPPASRKPNSRPHRDATGEHARRDLIAVFNARVNLGPPFTGQPDANRNRRQPSMLIAPQLEFAVHARTFLGSARAIRVHDRR